MMENSKDKMQSVKIMCASLLSARYFKILLLTFAFFIFTFESVYAGESPNYIMTAEVIDMGGASMDSTSYGLFAKIREYKPEFMSSPSFTMEGRFMGIVYGSGTVSTLETPTVTSIIPTSGFVNVTYHAIINGTLISTDAIARLSRSGPPYIFGTSVTVDSSTSMECDFSLAGAAVGAWNVDIINHPLSTQNTGSLASAFTVMSPGAPSIIGTPWNDPNPFDPGSGPTKFRYTLTAPGTIALYLFNQNGELIWQQTYSPTDNGGRAGDNDPSWDGFTRFHENVPTGVYILMIVSKTGNVKEIGRIKVAVIRR